VAWSTPDKVTLMALDHEGRDVWSRDLGSWTSQHGFGTSPMLHEDMVVLSNNQQAQQLEPGQTPGESYMLAFDAKTGKDRWRTQRAAVRVCYSTPCIYQPPGGSPQLVCTSTGDGVYALDPNTGRELWKAADTLRMRVVSSPLVAGGLIFGSTGSGGGGNYVVAVRPGQDARVAYTIRSSAPYVPSIVAKDGLMFLFYDRGVATCADVSSGRVHWRERLSDGFSGSPIIADGKVYCIGDDGVVYVLAASQQFQLLGENPLGEPTRSTPAVAGGKLYLRTLSHLFSIGK
jgi:outer membrane protein assembly factor BamB